MLYSEQFNPFLFSPMKFQGMDIIEAPVKLRPKIQLSEHVQVTDEFRKKENAWLLDMFGCEEVCAIPEGMAYKFGNTLIMRPEEVVKLVGLVA